MMGENTMTPDELMEIGEQLYGRWGWQLKLSKALDVNENTIRRWKTGHSPLLPETIRKIRKLQHSHHVPEISPHSFMLDILANYPSVSVVVHDGVFTLNFMSSGNLIAASEKDNEALVSMKEILKKLNP